MKLAMFGVTGTVGSVLLERALREGHQVQALVRSASSLKTRDQNLSVTHGDVGNAAAVDAVLNGVDGVLSTLGGSRGPESLSIGTATITSAMAGHGVRRIVVAQGFHLRFPGDPANFGQRVMGLMMSRLIPGINENGAAMVEALLRCDLDWTVVRMCRVVTDNTRHPGRRDYRTGTLRLAPWSTVQVGDAADFMLECVGSDRNLRQAPMIASR
ncbi:hypothetical protein BJG92_03520 [Arthrobacter sp. SO5]|uniref:NAD(P)-dependent oxidoreductase n=1 Tax=Arthrobacter sp. SO5 TaxID=1897055 RepID=UPI001E50055F|nr:NAD(P)H-binding protein [Arthrobacter sp. SO5]MCB5275965.1 hypothetical protein [Arthrobacter sp. SO5]